MKKTLLWLAVALAATRPPLAQTRQLWEQQEFFQNSESRTSYFYSSGNVSGASRLELINKKLPVDTSSFVSAPNSLRA